ncbi:MAG: hypothetical protein KME27_11180 [Lyngbya sp. HA4199-MV5]|jgi:hypothetical protein|nr:hypothetical protein [Lyngbya sp. HA4199-MV5]
MVSPSDRPIIFELVVRSGHPNLLEGLDVWLRLGLLSEATVLQICADHLVCPLPAVAVVRSGDDFVVANDFVTEAAPEAVGAGAPREPTREPSPIARGIQSFMAEVSVIWLLFLGVFMVVVSSGVLAATQWRNFSPVGQYGILFAYTLAFWAASAWAGRQPNLRLTARMLQIATLLIIPVNFWMMDGFRLLSSGLGWAIAAIAALVLTGITMQLLKGASGERGVGSGGERVGKRERLTLGMAIALSWLHWGWGWDGFPLVATYVGTIGATIALVGQDRELGVGSRESGVGRQEAGGRRQEAEAASEETEVQEDSAAVDVSSPAPAASPASSISLLTPLPSPLSLSTITIAIATLLLLARAVLAAGVPINRLGLAVGICGWLLCWLGRQDASRLGWQRGGVGLLLVGWLIAVTVTPPWQAIAISGLSLWLLADSWRRSGQGTYLTAGWFVGLQTVWLLWRAVPLPWQQGLIGTSIRLAGQAGMPIALLGLWFFPYLVLTVWLSGRLRRWQQPELAKQAEWLAFGLGLALTAVSFGNGWTRSLNLILSTFTLISVLRGRTRSEAFLIYLTHGTGLAAIASLIHLCLPNLSQNTWAALLLVGAIIEWTLSASLLTPHTPHPTPPSPSDSPTPYTSHLTPLPLWQQTTWHAGLLLAATSYLLLFASVLPEWTLWGLLRRLFWNPTTTVWGSIWLVTPIALTVLGSRRGLPQRRSASVLSVIALFLVQVLMFNSMPAQLTGLGTAFVLMVINTHQLRQLSTAIITIGFGLAFAADVIWESVGDSLTIELSVNLLAIALLLLWLLWGWLRTRETVLATLYRQATDGWAIALAVLTLIFLTLCHLAVYIFETPHWQYLTAACILFAATSYRTWRRPQNASFYAIAWSLELIITGIVSLTGRSLDAVAIANLAMGLGTQLLGEWWMVNRGVGNEEGLRGNPETEPAHPSSFILYPSPPSSWHLIPLLYALIGLSLQHRSFTATTGLYTLAAVLVGIGVGRRQPFRPLVYLSVLGGTIAAYELLIYQLSQAKGGEAGDGIVLMAGLAAAIAIVTRLLQRWLVPYLRLAGREVAIIAHGHWVLGSALMPVALIISLSSSGAWLWTGIVAILAAYALAMGREGRGEGRGERGAGEAEGEFSSIPHPTPHTPHPFWIYAGIIEAIAALTHLLHQFLPDATLLTWGGTIAAGLAFGLYRLPWRRWGWQREPWERSAAILPVAVTVLTLGTIAVQGLLIVAAFYAWLAKAERQVRLSYIGVLLADWAVLRWLDSLGTTEPLWVAALGSASLLYLAQVDPALSAASDRDKRHLLRSLATALVCLTAFYQAEVGITGVSPLLLGFLSIGLQLGFILAGLVLRIRAFLFVGTAVFMLQVLRQLWRFIDDYSLLLWALGILLGLIFIWIAATFEARRSQISALIQYWVTELEAWE